MKKNEPIQSVMTPDPIHVESGEKVSKVRRLLASQEIHHIPVTASGKLVGIVSSTDMMKLTLEAWGSEAAAVDDMLDRQFSLEQVMQPSPQSLLDSDTVRGAAEVLSSGSFHSVPIVDERRLLVGIVTTTDLIGYLLDQY